MILQLVVVIYEDTFCVKARGIFMVAGLL